MKADLFKFLVKMLDFLELYCVPWINELVEKEILVWCSIIFIANKKQQQIWYSEGLDKNDY